MISDHVAAAGMLVAAAGLFSHALARHRSAQLRWQARQAARARLELDAGRAATELRRRGPQMLPSADQSSGWPVSLLLGALALLCFLGGLVIAVSDLLRRVEPIGSSPTVGL